MANQIGKPTGDKTTFTAFAILVVSIGSFAGVSALITHRCRNTAQKSINGLKANVDNN
jgi:hypothetical protein